MFGSATKAAVEAFQRRRGLPITGRVDRATWSVLIEAGHVLGSRSLEHVSPMLRGDDVADLQQRLCALGFDTDRVDGIFGGLTANAVAEFQKNIGLTADGKAGPATIDQLFRLGGLSTLTRSVTAVRDGESLRNTSRAERYKTIGLSALGIDIALIQPVKSELERVGLTVHLLDVAERKVPQAANSLAVDLYLGLSKGEHPIDYRTLFYSGYAYESASGKALATEIMSRLTKDSTAESNVVGMALPLLRETLMTAVIIESPEAKQTPSQIAELAQVLAFAITSDELSQLDTH